MSDNNQGGDGAIDTSASAIAATLAEYAASKKKYVNDPLVQAMVAQLARLSGNPPGDAMLAACLPTQLAAAEPAQPDVTSAAHSMVLRGWLEAAVAWEVCGSIHRTYAKGKDALFKTRQSDYVRHAEDCRSRFLALTVENKVTVAG